MRPLSAPRRPAPAGATPEAAAAAARARRRDPAPSIWAYRAQRLLLTPIWRRLLRVGVPAFALAFGGLWLASDPARVQAILDTAHEIRREVENRPEFRVALLEIDGAGAAVADEVRGALALDLPASSFDLDLPGLRERVAALPAVAGAELRLLPGGVLRVTVRERRPAYVWQTRDGIFLIDAEGHHVAALAERGLDAPLPVLAGRGADLAVAEAADLLAAAAPLGDRLQGLVRVGQRRWDVVLRDGPRLQLPADGARAALDRVLAFHDVAKLLDRDVRRVDLRDPARPTVQLAEPALANLRRMRAGLPPLDPAQVPTGDSQG